MVNDIRGFYKRLGVQPTTSQPDIKSAYRALAKEYHPDSGNVSDDGRAFRAIAEAYSVLGDPESRAAYDGASAAESITHSNTAGTKIEPIRCNRCLKETAQPRHVVFWQVISLIVTTIRTPVQGIYCSACARRVAYRATFVSAIAGWWGVPWGPIYTIKHSLQNAFGGSSDQSVEENLAWHNAVAFADRRNFPIAMALARRLSVSANEAMVRNSAALMEFFGSEGIPLNLANLTYPWKLNPTSVVIQLAALAAVPTIVLMVWASSNNIAHPLASTEGSTPTVLPAEVGAQASVDQAAVPPIPEAKLCNKRLWSGKRLGGRLKNLPHGHVLEIANGSGGNAVIKVRSLSSRKLLTAFYVGDSDTARLSGLPDGNYTIQYALGNQLAADCLTFQNLRGASQFPEPEYLTAQHTAAANGEWVQWSHISYTLYPVPAGNVHPSAIDAATFNAP